MQNAGALAILDKVGLVEARVSNMLMAISNSKLQSYYPFPVGPLLSHLLAEILQQVGHTPLACVLCSPFRPRPVYRCQVDIPVGLD